MPTSHDEIVDVDKEPASSVDTGRRSSFKLPAPLYMSDEILDRNVWSPNRRNSSIVANGELRSSNSPRTLGPSQGSGGSNLGSPKPGTPTRFEDPLLSMPSLRRSGGSPTLEPLSTTGGGSAGAGASVAPMVLSPSLRAGSSSFNSFSARGSHIDFRRSVPGGSNVTSPAKPAVTARPSSARHPTLGPSDFGNLDLLGYASSFAGSESAGPGLDDDEVVDAEGDAVAAATSHSGLSPRMLTQASGAGSGSGGAPIRRHSAFVVHSASASSRTGYISPAARLAARASEDEEFMSRLQHNRSSWRERPRTGSHGPSGASFGGSPAPCEGLQNQTHAALQQLRGELKSLSMRSMQAAAMPSAFSSPPPPLTGGAAAGGGSSGSGGVHHVAATARTGGVTTGSGSGGGGSGGGVSSLGPGIGRFSEGQAQLSPSRLSLSRHHYSISGGSDGAVGHGASPELLNTCQSSPHAGPERRVQQMAAASAVQAAAVAHAEARFCGQAL